MREETQSIAAVCLGRPGEQQHVHGASVVQCDWLQSDLMLGSADGPERLCRHNKSPELCRTSAQRARKPESLPQSCSGLRDSRLKISCKSCCSVMFLYTLAPWLQPDWNVRVPKTWRWRSTFPVLQSFCSRLVGPFIELVVLKVLLGSF